MPADHRRIKALIHSLTEALVIWSVTLINGLDRFVQEAKPRRHRCPGPLGAHRRAVIARAARLIPSQGTWLWVNLVRLEARRQRSRL